MDGGDSPACFLSLVIPAYNEADGIAHALGEADAALRRLGRSYEIVVVDDGSRDATAHLVEQAALRYPAVRLVRHEINRGYGAALRSGFEAARGDRVAFTDADCQFFLADLGALLELTRRHDIAVGWRMDRKDPWLRRFYSRGYNLLVRTLLGATVRDIDCALKVFRRDALAKILPDCRGFFVNTEMLARARQLQLSVAETGVRHRPRLRGSSKVSILDIPRTLNALLPFWWSSALFAGGASARGATRGLTTAGVGLLAVMACLLFFGRLGAPLLEPEEARYAEIPRQMLEEGRFITPVLHGASYYHKPPLLYWLVMGCYRLFGVHDWAARLVPATAGVLIVLLTCAWGMRTAGRWAGLLGAAMLCLSAKFIYQAGMLTFDSLTALWVVASLAAAHVAIAVPDRSNGQVHLKRGWWLLAGALCGLGVLTKGPVALMLVAPPVAVWQFLDRRTARLTLRDWLHALGMMLIVAGPWFALVLWRDPRALVDFVWTHHVLRYVAPLDHPEPIWFYVAPLLVGMLPWSLVAAPLARHLLRRRARAARRRPPALGFFLLTFLWCFAFFSLSGCKRQGYILPAFPCLALALGAYLAHAFAWDRLGAWLRIRAHPAWTAWCHRVTLGALGVAALVGVAAGWRGIWPWPLVAAWGLAMTAALALVARLGAARQAWRSGAICGVTIFALLLGAVHELLPGYHRLFALRGQVRRHRDLDVPVASYPKRWDSVSFYLRRNDVEAYTPQQRDELIDDLRRQRRTLLFVKQGPALEDLLEALPHDMAFVPHGRAGAIVIAGLVQVRD